MKIEKAKVGMRVVVKWNDIGAQKATITSIPDVNPYKLIGLNMDAYRTSVEYFALASSCTPLVKRKPAREWTVHMNEDQVCLCSGTPCEYYCNSCRTTRVCEVREKKC
jgi:hypothetical protein